MPLRNGWEYANLVITAATIGVVVAINAAEIALQNLIPQANNNVDTETPMMPRRKNFPPGAS